MCTGPTDEVTVQVAVSDENDNVPQFSENPVLYGVSVDAPVNQLLATLQVIHSLFTLQTD